MVQQLQEKLELALSVQSKLPSFIVNADSMQVYDKFNILTNKPKTKDIKNGNCKLFGFINYPDKCNVGLWRNKSIELLKDKKNSYFCWWNWSLS